MVNYDIREYQRRLKKKISKSLTQKGKILKTANIDRGPGLSKRIFRQSLNILQVDIRLIND